MADLPVHRLETDKPPFTNVAIDPFGPIYVKVNRSEVKRYGCIFTCLNTRAVHLEMLSSLDTDSFINGFRRFCARRGKPDVVYSDNGKNLTSGEAELRKALKSLSKEMITSYATRINTTWFFIPPLSPHTGGHYERLIGVCKRAMRGLFQPPVRLTEEILSTLLCEVESIVNGRPITKLSDHKDDISPLTPNHLLLLRDGPRIPPGNFVDADRYRRRWRHVQFLADQFWRKWLRLYLPELQRRVKWHKVMTNLKPGDLVLLCDQMTPRNLWPLAVVQEVFPGRDNLVRSVRIRTRTGSLVRPLSKLVVLESAGEFDTKS